MALSFQRNQTSVQQVQPMFCWGWLLVDSKAPRRSFSILLAHFGRHGQVGLGQYWHTDFKGKGHFCLVFARTTPDRNPGLAHRNRLGQKGGQSESVIFIDTSGASMASMAALLQKAVPGTRVHAKLHASSCPVLRLQSVRRGQKT